MCHRVVSEVYTDRDPRPSGERPLAADIFLSFWHFFMRQPIEYLRTLFLYTVQERTMNENREFIYGLMRKDNLGVKLSIRRGGNQEGETHAFNLTNSTKFGICARTIERENEVMRYYGIKVSEFEFHPRDNLGDSYNVLIHFDVVPSHHQHHRGHRRRH